MRRPVVTLLTDFGEEDTFVGQMKGVLLGQCPEAVLVDLTHLISPQSLLEGSFHLAAAWSSFSPGTVHLAVVDPGVGSERRALALRYNAHHFILPDNGLISAVLGGNDPEFAVAIPVPQDSHVASRTFHGRDVFAPVAGRLAAGTDLRDLGEPVEPSTIIRFDLPEPAKVDDAVVGEIIVIDRFGNAMTNISASNLADLEVTRAIECEAFTVRTLSTTYQDVGVGEPLALISSMGTVELAVRDGSAEDRYNLSVGHTVRIRGDRVRRQ